MGGTQRIGRATGTFGGMHDEAIEADDNDLYNADEEEKSGSAEGEGDDLIEGAEQ